MIVITISLGELLADIVFLVFALALLVLVILVNRRK